MSEWEEVTFGDVFEISSAKRVTKSQWKNEGVPFYRAREVVKLAREGSVANELFISEEMFQEYSEKYGVPEDGDLMVSGVGTLGACYVVRPSDRFYYKDASVLRFHPKREICADYFKHAFRTRLVLDQVESGSGSTVGTYTISRAQRTRVPLPPLSEQKRIAEILDRAEALRAKRRAALALLDELTQSIFLEMFGDPVSNPKSLPRKRLGAIGRIVTGNTPPRKREDFYGEFIEWIKSDNLNCPNYYATVASEHLSVEGAKVGRIAPKESILITCIAGSPDCIGNAAMVDRNVAFNQQINAIVDPEANPHFLYAQTIVGKRLIQQVSSNGMKGIVSKGRLEGVEYLVPPQHDQDVFASRAMQIEEMKSRLLCSSFALAQLFASLQHRAFRGEL
ncbi:restriction endonuclease subunit S [Thalassoglobus sp.]|uniref:restriction endonuclease subunit S n=1 Tax=Thalassoglobus sp. TaxID=2795869 RepID=UPI003AA943EC